MSIISEIGSFLKYFQLYEIIDEGQIGINFRFGVARARHKRYRGQELEQIIKEEREVLANLGGPRKFLSPFETIPELPEGYGRKFLTGFPKHPKRYEKDVNLQPGFYALIPLVDALYADHNQERRIASKAEDMVIVPTTDGAKVALGFILNAKIVDYYKAYTCGDDYEELLRGQASAVLAKLASGKTTKDWEYPNNYKDIADHTLIKLQKIALESWGVSVSKFALTQIVTDPVVMVGYGLSPATSSYAGASIGLGASAK